MKNKHNQTPADNLGAELTWLANKTAMVWVVAMTAVSFVVMLLCICGILHETALWSLLWAIPAGASLAAALHYYNRKARQLLHKQQILAVAYHAKQAINNLQRQMPDTLISDSRIRMRYLVRHGIDADAALMRLGNDVEAYNERVKAFLRESGRYEDVLYDLLRPATLMQYGAHAHVLRIKANELGMTRLTDTAFFHEIEAYAGDFATVRANWQKLACELDEAYALLDEYAGSLGLGDAAIGSDGSRMTFKEWSGRLQQAFLALETYDTGKAKEILNELVEYRIDSDITSSLKNIIANINEIGT